MKTGKRIYKVGDEMLIVKNKSEIASYDECVGKIAIITKLYVIGTDRFFDYELEVKDDKGKPIRKVAMDEDEIELNYIRKNVQA